VCQEVSHTDVAQVRTSVCRPKLDADYTLENGSVFTKYRFGDLLSSLYSVKAQ
jgi:hypothetical protein